MSRSTAQKYRPTRSYLFVKTLARYEWLPLATFTPKVQILRFSMVKNSRSRSILEGYLLRLIPSYAVRERIVTHLVLRYTNTNPVRHPLSFVRVTGLIHLEILLHHLRSINGLRSNL